MKKHRDDNKRTVNEGGNPAFPTDIKIQDENIPDRVASEMLVRKLMTDTCPDRTERALEKMEEAFPGITKEYIDAVGEYNRTNEYKTLNDRLKGGESLRGMKETGFVYKNAFAENKPKRPEIGMGFMTKNEILKLARLRPYDLLVKSTFGGVPLGRFVYYTDKNEATLVNTILDNPKFKNIKIDENLINMLTYTDNILTVERNLFYPAFFIDTDFTFGPRFVVKGLLVFECFTTKLGDKIKKIEFNTEKGVNDTRVHFVLIDKESRDVTCLGISFVEIREGLDFSSYILPEYIKDRSEITKLVESTVRTTCNIIDLIEGNKDELETRLVIPPVQQNEKRLKKGKSPITTTVIIKPKKELLAYASAFETEHRKVNYSHKFVVRGHYRHLGSEWYKDMHGKKIWIKPFLKGHGILIKKDAFFTDINLAGENNGR